MPYQFRRGEQVEMLIHHARDVAFFTSEQGLPCAGIPTGPLSREVVALHAPAFRDWLLHHFFIECDAAPTAGAFRQALRHFESSARMGAIPRRALHRRVAGSGGAEALDTITLDLANQHGEAVEITPDGWTVADAPEAVFLNTASTRALPAPAVVQDAPKSEDAPKSIARLRPLLNLSEPAFQTALAWLLCAFRPNAAYPILIIKGPPNSGRSTCARMLRGLIDPSHAPLLRLPRVKDIPALARHNWILAFDHVGRLSQQHGAALASLSTGDGSLEHAPNGQPILATTARPVILIQDETTPVPQQLAHLAVVIHLPVLARQRTHTALWTQYNQLRPAALAAICGAIARALSTMRRTCLETAPRLADAVAWTSAASPALGLPENALLHNDPGHHATPAIAALHAHLESHGNAYAGSASDLHGKLARRGPLGLPKTAKGLVQWLASLPGIESLSEKRPDGRRTLIVKRLVAAHLQSSA